MLKKKQILLLILIIVILIPKAAFAYLDPGTGSYVLQVVIALFIGAIYSVKIYWTKIKTFIKRTFSKEKES